MARLNGNLVGELLVFALVEVIRFRGSFGGYRKCHFFGLRTLPRAFALRGNVAQSDLDDERGMWIPDKQDAETNLPYRGRTGTSASNTPPFMGCAFTDVMVLVVVLGRVFDRGTAPPAWFTAPIRVRPHSFE